MATYPNLNNEAEILKIKTKDHQLKELQFKSDKLDQENIIKSPKIDNEYHIKCISLLKKRKYFYLSLKI